MNYVRLQDIAREVGISVNTVVPIVMIDVISNHLKFDNVCSDDRMGMKEITRLVLSQSYRNIVFLNIREHSAPAIERLAGVYDALAEVGREKSFIKVYTNTHKNFKNS